MKLPASVKLRLRILNENLAGFVIDPHLYLRMTLHLKAAE
jgi:hypothetical protein